MDAPPRTHVRQDLFFLFYLDFHPNMLPEAPKTPETGTSATFSHTLDCGCGTMASRAELLAQYLGKFHTFRWSGCIRMSMSNRLMC